MFHQIMVFPQVNDRGLSPHRVPPQAICSQLITPITPPLPNYGVPLGFENHMQPYNNGLAGNQNFNEFGDGNTMHSHLRITEKHDPRIDVPFFVNFIIRKYV